MSDPDNVSYHTINEIVSSKSSTEEGKYNSYLTWNTSKIFYSEIIFITMEKQLVDTNWNTEK